MDKNKILSMCDHTLLKPTATVSEIKKLCDEAIKYKVASVCIPPSYVRWAKEYCGDRMKVCTVIGFPNGYSTTRVKVLEAQDAIANGADEIDMVVNIGLIKEKRWDLLLEEINLVKNMCGAHVLKIIIETALLADIEIIRMCEVINASDADFIKTSTGFSTRGASFRDVHLMEENIRDGIGIKAAGGISSFEDAEEFIRIGATRLGTSRLVKLMKSKDNTSDY